MHRFGKLVLLSLLATAVPASAQQTGTVTGTVTDSGNGQVIAGAQVYLPGLQLGALSNAQGRFLIVNVPVGAREVRAELIGRAPATQTVTVQAGQAVQVNFILESRAVSLEGVVVTGVAAATPRTQLAFTVEQVKAADIMKIVPVSAGTAIQGKIAGATIISGSGQPGSEPSIMFRGPTSITGSQAPLIIVDGVITHGGLADIDPQDIATMEVVKGAAAASLYGSRAQAGVIQITTKRGSSVSAGRTEVTFRQTYNAHNIERFNGTALSHPYRLMPDGSAFMGFDGKPVVLPALTGAFPLDDKGNGSDSFRSFSDKAYPEPTWDPWKQTYQNGSNYSTYVSVGGNGGKTQYQVSGNYVRDTGNMAFLNGLTQKNFRLNVDHQVGGLRMALSTYLTRGQGDDILEGGTGANRFGFDPFLNLGFLSPKANLTDTDANGNIVILGDQVGWGVNPLYRLSRESHTKNNQRIMGGLDLNYAPSSWLGFESNVSYDRSDLTEQHYQPPGLLSSAQPNRPFLTGYLAMANTITEDFNGSVTGNVTGKIGDLTARSRLRWLVESRDYSLLTAQGSSLLVADVPRLSLATSGITNDLTQQSVRSEGLFLVNTLTYKDRYVLDVLGRRDGSSLFGADERWQNYYRVALAWRMASEPWWPFEIIDDFKPRFSRGTAGGRPQFDAQYQTYFVGVGSISPGVLGNSKLKPEHATETEIGFDASIAHRFTVQANYVTSRVDDQLLLTPLTVLDGFRSQWRNAGTLASKTYELTLETALAQRSNLLWTAKLNASRTTQKVTHLSVPPYRVEGYRAGLWIREGEVLGSFYGVKWATDCAVDLPAGTDCSQFQVNDYGHLVYVGKGNSWKEGISKSLWGTNGTLTDAALGTTTYNWGIPIRSIADGGITKMGNTQPDLNLSIAHDLQYRSFGLSMLFDSQWGGEIYDQTRAFACRDLRCPEADQRGIPDALKKPTAYYNRAGVYASNDNNSWFIENSDFVKLREVSLSYTLKPGTLPSFMHVGVDRAVVSLTGHNVKTWTGYPGTDPEVGSDTFLGSAAIGRIDEYTYPNFRTFGLDVELGF